MPAKYDSGGLRFLYPENWTVVDDEPHALPRTVTLQSPATAFWSVDIHPFSVDPRELAAQVLREMQRVYADLESSPITEEHAGENATGHDLHFSCMDFIVTAQLRALRHGHATYLLTYQAEDREFQAMRQVFQAISHSLLRSDLES